MLLVVYDVQEDKLRTKLSKFLTKFGRRVQYSVIEIKNSKRILDNIKTEITTKFEKKFGQGDSVLIYEITDNSKIETFGYPVNEESDLCIF